MRFSETITIYLAAGAPFSVSYFLHERADGRISHRILRAIATGLLWPLAAFKMLLAGYAQTGSVAGANRASRQREVKIYESKRHLLAELHMVSELGARARGDFTMELERAACVLRESVETYVGLAPAVGEISVESTANKNSIELFRVAGRTGDDLLIAARCVQRRNAARMLDHHARARTQLIHAIADIHEVTECAQPSIGWNLLALQHLRLATASLFDHALDLLLLMGDKEAANKIASLIKHERLHQRRQEATEAGKVLATNTEGEPCTALTARPALAPSSNETTMARG